MADSIKSEFYSAKPEHIIHTLELYHKEAAVVSRDLMLLNQTAQCSAVLSVGAFFSVEDWLPKQACDIIRESFINGTTQAIDIDIDGMQRTMRISPLENAVLLLFDPVFERLPVLLVNSVKLRDCANKLMAMTEDIQDRDVASKVRREALILLKYAARNEILGGEGNVNRSVCDLKQLIDSTAEKIREKGVDIESDVQNDLRPYIDSHLIKLALASIIANSIRYGGDNVHISVRAKKAGNDCIIRIDDDGPGISSDVIRKQNAWNDPDTDMMDRNWGLGIPFAERIVHLHGGRLQYIFGGSGCTVCMILPEAHDSVLEMPSIYEAETFDPVEIEFSDLF